MSRKLLLGAGLILTAATAVFAASKAEEMRDIDGFEAVALHGSMDVDVTVGDEYSVRVVASERMIDRIETEVRGDTLRIKLEDGHYRHTGNMHVYVTMPAIAEAGIYGSGDMKIMGDIGGDFEFNLHGSGDGYIENVDVSDLELSIHGSGDVRIEGSCDTLEIDVHGSGDIEG